MLDSSSCTILHGFPVWPVCLITDIGDSISTPWSTMLIATSILLATGLLLYLTTHAQRALFDPLPVDVNNHTLPFSSFLYSNILPNRAMSRVMEPLSHRIIPTKLRSFLFKTIYGSLYPVQWNEFKPNVREYRSFHEFFTRSLVIPRKMASTDLVSPVDGTVVAFGEVNPSTHTLEQIKGVRFNLGQFLYGHQAATLDSHRFPELSDNNNRLFYTILYLSPGDYHRFHSPADDIKVSCIRHIVGDLYPVKLSWLRTVPGLFSLNERMVLSGKWQRDWFFAYVPVGAFNVGSIHLKDFEHHVTNQKVQDKEVWYRCAECDVNSKNVTRVQAQSGSVHCMSRFDEGNELLYDKGDEVGYFSFGSTVVLIFEAPKSFEFNNLNREQKIRFGEPLGHIGKME